MITFDQARQLTHGQIVHCEIVRLCVRHVGPRGGVQTRTVQARVSGKVQTWKTRPGEFRVPVKYGLYEHGEITHTNANQWHVEEDCPLNEPKYPRNVCPTCKEPMLGSHYHETE